MRRRIVAAAVMCACNSSPAVPDEDGPLAEFRGDLADPAKYPIRRGTSIDEEALNLAIARAMGEHAEALEDQYEASVAALPVVEAPSLETYKEIVRQDVPQAERSYAAKQWAWSPDASRLAKSALGTSLPLAMIEMKFSTDEMMAWLSFLNMARPKIARCGQEPGITSLCLDYGGLDVFIIDFVAHGRTRSASRVRWMQKLAE